MAEVEIYHCGLWAVLFLCWLLIRVLIAKKMYRIPAAHLCGQPSERTCVSFDYQTGTIPRLSLAWYSITGGTSELEIRKRRQQSWRVITVPADTVSCFVITVKESRGSGSHCQCLPNSRRENHRSDKFLMSLKKAQSPEPSSTKVIRRNVILRLRGSDKIFIITVEILDDRAAARKRTKTCCA